MTEFYTFIVPIRPQVKQRPRMSKRGKVYTPAKTREYEQFVGECYDGPLFEGPVSVEIELSNEHAVIRIAEAEKPDYYLRGDLTNYVKAIEDGLNGIAYKDDRQIVSLMVVNL